jgi:aspartyl aminopeptidase
MTSLAEDLLAFIDASPSPYHAVRVAAARLESAGFRRLEETDRWNVAPGERCYAVRGDASLVAFAIGRRGVETTGLRIVGAHTDSPTLRLKPCPDLAQHGYRQLAVEPYGSPLLYTWFDRDLSIAGRVSLVGDSGLRTVLVDLERPLLRIPSLAIHLQRDIHEQGFRPNAQTHLPLVLGLGDGADLRDLVASAVTSMGGAPCAVAQIAGFDLVTYDVQPSAVGGAQGELIFASRLDNLASCHAALVALIAAVGAASFDASALVVLYDHEEVGSRSPQGAQGTLLADTIARLAAASGDPQSQPLIISRSMAVSADMAHAVHPNYADRHEPGHRPIVGRGPVVKHNANLAYASDAPTVGRFVDLCRRRGLEPQHFVVRSDLPCGSTIGPLMATRIGVPTVDVGNPMLSMHSCREMAGVADVGPMIGVLTDFLSGA